MTAAFRFGFLPKLVETRLQEWIKESDSVNVFVAGKTGTGKTTLVHGLVGAKVIPTDGHTLDPGTKTVCEKLCKFEDILVKVFDTPGLQDGYGQEDNYLQNMIRRWKKVDLLVYCIRMDTRFVEGNSNIVSMRRLSESLGSGIWKNALIILTFANDFVAIGEEDGLIGLALEDYFEKKVKSWEEKLHTVLHEQVGVPKEIADSVAVVPAGQLKRLQLLPNGECWMSRLWLKALAACSSRAQPAFIRINEHRFKSSNEINMQSQLKLQLEFLHDRPLILASKGEEIGAALGCPKGIGCTIGLQSGMIGTLKLILLLAQRNKIIDNLDSLLTPDRSSSKKQSTTKSTSALSASYGRIQMCAFCGKHTGKFQTCGSCKKVMYCNRECQKKDWNNHKTICQTERLQKTSHPKPCSGCEKKFLTLQSCPCHKAAYCSKECQRMDWYKHKPDCTAIKRV